MLRSNERQLGYVQTRCPQQGDARRTILDALACRSLHRQSTRQSAATVNIELPDGQQTIDRSLERTEIALHGSMNDRRHHSIVDVARHSGTASAKADLRTSSRRRLVVVTSTSRPMIARTSAAKPASGSTPCLAALNSTRRSTSDVGVSSPRAVEPKTRMLRILRFRAAFRISVPCSRRCARSSPRAIGPARNRTSNDAPVARTIRSSVRTERDFAPDSYADRVGCDVPAACANRA